MSSLIETDRITPDMSGLFRGSGSLHPRSTGDEPQEGSIHPLSADTETELRKKSAFPADPVTRVSVESGGIGRRAGFRIQ